MNKSFKLFLIFSCVFTNIIKTSAPLTKENLRRLQKGLPLQPKYKELPLQPKYVVPKTGKPLTRLEQYELGTHYSRRQETDDFFTKLHKNPFPSNKRSKNPYTRYEQEKFQRLNSAKKYPALHEYFGNTNQAKS